MAGTSRDISSVMTSAANNYNTRHNSGNYETRDSARRTDRASASSRLCLIYISTTPWLRSPASIVARHAITLIVRLGT